MALLSKNGLLYVLEYNNKLTMLYSKYFLYNITVAGNEIYGLARERPKIDKNKKDNYYLFKWSSKYNSENDLYSDNRIIDSLKVLADKTIIDAGTKLK